MLPQGHKGSCMGKPWPAFARVSKRRLFGHGKSVWLCYLNRKKTVAVFCDQDGDMLEPMLLPQCFIFPSVEPLNSMIPLRPAGIDRNAAESCFLATQRGLKIGDVELISHRWATDGLRMLIVLSCITGETGPLSYALGKLRSAVVIH